MSQVTESPPIPDAPEPDAGAAPAAELDCSIARALGVIGDRWTILIMRDAFRGIRRFDDFRRDLDIARPVLADRLKKLVDAGIMVRRRYQTSPERFEYRLTPMGMELSPALVARMRWGDRWLSHRARSRTLRIRARAGLLVPHLPTDLHTRRHRQPQPPLRHPPLVGSHTCPPLTARSPTCRWPNSSPRPRPAATRTTATG
jgi:DNA-binding HxlR family transcriptional regulator